MPVRIRLARGGAKKRPFYRIVVADSRRARDGKFIDQVGTYNPMLPKDSPERVKIDVEKTKDWIAKGAQPSDRVTLFLSKLDVVEKPVITEKTKKHLPKKKVLSAMSLFKSPTLDFGEQSVRLNEEGGGSSLKYFFSDPSVVTTPKTEITMPSVDVEFTFTQDTFNAISKASAVLGVPDVVLKGTAGGDIELTVTDRKNETSNDFSIKVGDNSPSDFTYYFKVENLKLLGGDYKVQVSAKGISHFSHVNKSVEYFIALEQA